MDQVVVSTPLGLVLLDPETGNISQHLNDSNASIVCPVGISGQGGVTGPRVICCPQLSKGLVHYWRFNSVTGAIESSGNPVYKCSSPEKFSALCFSSCSGLMFAGTPSGTIFVWQTWTGAMLRSWTGHFGAVTSIRVSADDMYLYTASEDATVKKYFIPHLFAESKMKAQPVPLPCASFEGHTGRINDMCLLASSENTLVTASGDKSVKIFTESGVQTAHYSLDNTEPTRICADNVSNQIFAGCSDGSVRVLAQGRDQRFKGAHKGAVAGIAILLDCSKIVSCAEDGVRIWDVVSRVQFMHVLGPNQQVKNSLGLLMIRKPLPAHENSSVSSGEKLVLAIDAYLQFKPLQRTLTPVAQIDVIPLIRAKSDSEPLSKVKNGFVVNKTSLADNFSSKDDIVASLTAEVAKAKEAAQMWASMCQELYLQASALRPDGQAELHLPIPQKDPESKAKKRRN